jgi:hypothetical protein
MKAFPSSEPIHGNDVIGVKQSYGMELRDYFAAKSIDYFVRDVWLEKETDDFDDAAKKCYAMADAMMKAREQ